MCLNRDIYIQIDQKAKKQERCLSSRVSSVAVSFEKITKTMSIGELFVQRHKE